jgi:hypothetical protein
MEKGLSGRNGGQKRGAAIPGELVERGPSEALLMERHVARRLVDAAAVGAQQGGVAGVEAALAPARALAYGVPFLIAFFWGFTVTLLSFVGAILILLPDKQTDAILICTNDSNHHSSCRLAPFQPSLRRAVPTRPLSCVTEPAQEAVQRLFRYVTESSFASPPTNRARPAPRE